MLKRSALIAGIAMLLGASGAQAFVIDTSLMIDNPDLASTWDNSNTQTLDKVLTSLDEEVDNNQATAKLVDTETWVGWGATSVILEEIAGHRDHNTFGWYDVSSPSTLNQIFSGPENKSTDPVTVNFGTQTDFGFYLGSKNDGAYYSEKSLNAGGQQVLVFKIEELSNTYLLAWEDLNMAGHSDADFQDMIVRVRINVPEPATLGLFGMGVLSLVAARRRQKSQQS